MTIIFFTVYPLNEDYAIKYGFDVLKKRGFDIVILHVFDYLFDDDLKAYSEQYGELTPVLGIEQTHIRSKSDF